MTNIRDLKLKDWQPRSMMVAKETRPDKPAFPVIDVHNHLGDGSRVRQYLEEMDAAGVRCCVHLDGGSGESLRKTLRQLDEAYPGRFLTFALIDFSGFEKRGWSEREAKRLAASFDMGAKGLKIHKSLGLEYRREDGSLLMPDDPVLDPLWETCADCHRPVMIHTADPAAFFAPLDRFNERWHELNANPNWVFHGDQFPGRDELLEARNRAIARHRETTFIGAHVANNPEDLATVAKWLDDYPNLHVDIDARISELGRQPYSARRFLIRYQDRVMFGTDTPPRAEVYRMYYRFLETDDEYFDCSLGHRQGFWMIYGLHLPDTVLKRIYHENAEKILFGLQPS